MVEFKGVRIRIRERGLEFGDEGLGFRARAFWGLIRVEGLRFRH